MIIRFFNIGDAGDFGQYEKYLFQVSNERRERVDRIKNPKMKSISLLSEVIMRREIGKALKIKESDIEFFYNEHGKPYVKNPDYHFSVSHTENVIVFTDSSVPVGIDIERIKPARLKVAERFFTPGEYERILSVPESADREFYRIWTMKEAYVKMTGTGLLTPLNSFDVDDEGLGVFFYNKEYEGFAISVCREGCEKEAVELVPVDWHTICTNCPASY